MLPLLEPLGYTCAVRGNERGGGNALDFWNVHEPDVAGGETGRVPAATGRLETRGGGNGRAPGTGEDVVDDEPTDIAPDVERCGGGGMAETAGEGTERVGNDGAGAGDAIAAGVGGAAGGAGGAGGGGCLLYTSDAADE